MYVNTNTLFLALDMTSIVVPILKFERFVQSAQVITYSYSCLYMFIQIWIEFSLAVCFYELLLLLI